MTNLDKAVFQDSALALVEAAKGDDPAVMQSAFEDFAANIKEQVIAEANELMDNADSQILAARGTRQLTRNEKDFYGKFIEAAKSKNPKQALTDVNVVLPKTVINDVFDSLENDHELLSVIDFQNTGGVVEWLMNTNENQLATWSPLCAEIVKELTGGFKVVNLTLCKLSAFLPVCKAMLDLGPEWLDRYVRTVLAEALALGLEDGIINGRGITSGTNEPIGMTRNLNSQSSAGYGEKDPVAITEITPTSWGAIRKQLATLMISDDTSKPRKVGEMLLVVNPLDYEAIVGPASTLMTPNGYIDGIFPSKTRVVQSVAIEQGKAVAGIANRYFMAAGTGSGGNIEYSDEYRFLEDERVYAVKFYGYGQPKDNSAFVVLDISQLKALAFPVYVTNNETPEG